MSHRAVKFVLGLFLLGLLPTILFAQARAKIVIGHASMSSVVLTLWAAQDRGFFAKNNIDAQLIFIPGSPTLIASLNTGDVHLGYTGGTATLGAVVGGMDLRMLASFANKVQSELVARPEFKTTADLKGKRIGVTSIGGTGWMSALLILEQIGLNVDRDKILLTAFGDQRVISQALEGGTIQGAALAGVFSRKLKRAGYWLPGEPDKIPLTGTALIVKPEYMRAHAVITRNVVKSLVEGHAYVLDPANKSSIFELLSKRLGLRDPAMAADGLQDYVSGVERKPFVSLDGLKNIQRFMKERNPKVAQINLDRLIDESYLREFEKSGYLDQLLGNSAAK